MTLHEAITSLLDEYYIEEFVEVFRDDAKQDREWVGLSQDHPRVQKFKEVCAALRMALVDSKGGEMTVEMNGHRPVLVTTAHRGVFFGYLVGDPAKEKVVINRIRSVTYWDAATRSFLGLAAKGPTQTCRVSAAAGAESTLFDITGVFACTPEAVKQFERGLWDWWG